jgi:hypothetical protein
MSMTAIPIWAEQYASRLGPHVADLEVAEESPGVQVGEEHPAGLV